MSYYRLLSCFCRFNAFLILFLGASCFSSVLLADEVYTVQIPGSPSVTVDWLSLMQEGQDNRTPSPEQTGIEAQLDTNLNIGSGYSSTLNNRGYDYEAPAQRSITAGRMPWYQLRTTYILLSNAQQFTSTKQNYQVPTPGGDDEEDITKKEENWLWYYNTVTFNWSLFRTKLIQGLFGADNLQWFSDVLTTLWRTPTGSDFSYNVPEIFGFDSGLSVTVPLYTILNGGGDYYIFSTIFTLIRAFFGFVYWTAFFGIILRVVCFYQ